MDNAPIKTFRSFNVSVSVFRNERDGKNGKFYTYSCVPQKSYKDDSGEYHNTTSFDGNDVLALAQLLEEAWSYITKKRASDAQELKEETEE